MYSDILNPQLFPSRFKNFLVHTGVFKSNSPVHTHMMVSGFTLEKLGLRSFAILVYCSARDWKRFYCVISRFTVHTLSDSLGIYLFFPLWRMDSKMSEFACGQKPYPEENSCGFKNIRTAVDGPLNVTNQPEGGINSSFLKRHFFEDMFRRPQWKFGFSIKTGQHFTVNINF